MRSYTLAASALLALVVAAPAAAQQYTVKQTGNLVELRDTRADMYVPVVTTVGRPWKIQVKGKDLVRTGGATPEAFEAGPGLNGMPPLFPFANRMDQTAFYANGQKYNFDTELGNVRGPIPSTGFVGGYKGWKLVEAKSDSNGAWVTCRLDFYKNPVFMKQWPFAHTVTVTYRVSNGTLEVKTRVDNMSEQPMPVVLGYHPIYELPEGTRDDWTVSIGAKTHWIETPQRLPTGETQPTENFFGEDRTAIHLKNYGLIDDVFTDLERDASGRATMKLMGGGKELVVMLGPKYKTVLAWSTALNAGGGGGRGGGGRAGGQGAPGAAGAGRAGGQGAPGAPAAPAAPFQPVVVDPATGVRTAPRAVAPAPTAPAAAPAAAPQGAPAPANRGFIAFEPMVAITNALNLAEKGVYKELQSVAPGAFWEESFWVTTKGY